MPLSAMRLRNWSQFAKIFSLIILLLVFTFSWVWFREIPYLQNDLIRERTHAAQYPVQIAISVLEVYRGRVVNGELTQQDAQARALRTLQGTRYANNQYFWVHDLSLTMLMHPFTSELVGKDLSTYQDSRGKYIFKEINNRIKNNSEGIIEYTWPRPGSHIPENKMSCYKYYEPWGWVIGSGIYLDDVEADIAAIKNRVIHSVISAFICAILFSLYVIYRINQPLRQTIAFAKQIESGHEVETIPINPQSEGGKVLGVIKGLLLDLQAAYKRQKSIIEATSDGFFIIGIDGIFKEVNQAFSHLTGYSRSELLSLHLEALGSPESTEIIRSHTAGPAEKGARRFECCYIHKDGRSVNVEVSANYIEEEPGNVICFVRDISEAKRLHAERRLLETQLIQSQKFEAIGKLAGGVAHEFNNALQVIDGYAMLMSEESVRKEHRDYLATIQSAVKRATRLTQGMLTYSRKQFFTLSITDVTETIRQIEPFLERTLPEDVDLVVELAPETIWCNMDAQHIQQSIINLVTNARDAIELRGSITVSTRTIDVDQKFVQQNPTARTGTFAAIAVTDNGSGISEAIRPNIFDPFFTTKDIGKGTGLGLSIVFGIIAQHNGFITCDSTPGNGSCFTLFLPVASPESTSATAINRKQKFRAANSRTILLAEDDKDVSKVIAMQLEKSGYHVLKAVDGNEAVVLFSAFKASIDLVLLDVMMPHKNGKEALEEIRAVDSEVPVCFMSGYASDTLGLDLVQAGIQAFLSKPVNHEQLLETIEKLLSQPIN